MQPLDWARAASNLSDLPILRHRLRWYRRTWRREDSQADDLADAVLVVPGATPGEVDSFVVCTGGEPLLQLDADLVAAFKARSIEIAIETNGTLQPPAGIDWICVSPKAGADRVLQRGHELKLVFPQGRGPVRVRGLDLRSLLPAADGRT